MSSSTTTVIVPGRAPLSGIPGRKTESQIRAMYSQELGLSNYQATERDENGVHIVEFQPRTGTKGYNALAAAV